jgi:hypothetical protein
MAVRFFAVDFAIDVPSPLQKILERKIRQILNEPPKQMLMVRVARFPEKHLGGVHADFACRVTICGVGAIPLQEESEFILYRKPAAPEALGYKRIIK